jgi:hypothetical protein
MKNKEKKISMKSEFLNKSDYDEYLEYSFKIIVKTRDIL